MYEYNQETALPTKNIEGVDVRPPENLTYQFFLQNKLPIWLLNTSAPPMSNIVMTIRQQGQPGTGVKLERSKAPQEVMVPHDQLRTGGRELWTLIQNGVLLLVWPSDAAKMLGGKVGEQQRKKLSKFSALNAEQSPEMVERARLHKEAQDAQLEAEAEQADTANPVNARVMDVVARNVAGELKFDAASAEFDMLEDLLTEHDYSYAITNVKSGKLREWLQTKLAAFKSAETKKPGKKPATKKARATGGVPSILDNEEPEMTPEEKEIELQEEAKARAKQRI